MKPGIRILLCKVPMAFSESELLVARSEQLLVLKMGNSLKADVPQVSQWHEDVGINGNTVTF